MTQDIRIRGAIEPKFTFLAGNQVEVEMTEHLVLAAVTAQSAVGIREKVIVHLCAVGAEGQIVLGQVACPDGGWTVHCLAILTHELFVQN